MKTITLGQETMPVRDLVASLDYLARDPNFRNRATLVRIMQEVKISLAAENCLESDISTSELYMQTVRTAVRLGLKDENWSDFVDFFHNLTDYLAPDKPRFMQDLRAIFGGSANDLKLHRH